LDRNFSTMLNRSGIVSTLVSFFILGEMVSVFLH
jgi:hypothetical protein